jgi:hypothetical protein
MFKIKNSDDFLNSPSNPFMSFSVTYIIKIAMRKEATPPPKLEHTIFSRHK